MLLAEPYCVMDADYYFSPRESRELKAQALRNIMKQRNGADVPWQLAGGHAALDFAATLAEVEHVAQLQLS